MSTALLIGATGLCGSHLLQLLLASPHYTTVRVLARRPTGTQHPKLDEHVVDFDRPDTYAHLATGSVLFSALGTTLKQAGSKDAQYKVDYTYQYQVAQAAARNGVPVLVLVSSTGADPQSMFFYTRIKGELERDVAALPFRHIHILQPGPLEGPRPQTRPGEVLSLTLLRGLNAAGILRSYRPIHGQTVAQAMLAAAQLADRPNAPKLQRTALADLFPLAERS